MRRRQGFTLVELLVAMALIIFIMAILSQAFVSATGTFRNLKATGDLANRLRAVTTLLQRDLAADHFAGKKRLSNPNFWVNGPPSQGFFRVYQGSAGVQEGVDLDGIGSYRSVNHALAFTIKVRGDLMGDFLTAGSNGGGNTPLVGTGPPAQTLSTLANFGPIEARYQSPGTYSYQWAEVTWFLVPQIDPNTGVQDTTITDTSTGTPAVPLYTLYRNQRLAVPDNNLVPTQPNGRLSLFQEVSCWPNNATGNLYFNNPIDLTVPGRRFGMGGAAYTPLTGALAGADIQVTDVISFDVRLLVSGIAPSPDPFVTLWQSPFNVLVTKGGINNGNSAFYPTNPKGPMVFDTWSSVVDSLSNYSQWNVAGQATSIPLWNATTQSGPIIQAIQITIRIWDPKTYQTREVTMVQAM